jgi:hypothetical protein
MRPIVKGATGPGAFILAGTEVFHRACAANVARSLRTRQEHEIVQLRGELAQLTIERDAREQEERIELARIERDLRRAREDLRAAQLARASSEAMLADRWIDQRLIAERDAALEIRDRAIRERDAARTEAALHQTIQGRTVTPPVAPQPLPQQILVVTPTSEDLDDSEIRFSLLELDPLE